MPFSIVTQSLESFWIMHLATVTAIETLNKIRFDLLYAVASVLHGGSVVAQLKNSFCDELETSKWGAVCRFSKQCLRC